MDFGTFLVRQHWLKIPEFAALTSASLRAAEGRKSPDGYLEPSLREVLESSERGRLRPYPLGDVLRNNAGILSEALNRSGAKDFEDLVAMWQQWHVDEVEPISDFCLSPRQRSFGERLYNCEAEKRSCAEYVARTFIHAADHVVIPEGTSTFWCGLGALRHWSNLCIITSNGALVRELHENPRLRRRVTSVNVVGGQMDLDPDKGGAASRGFVGEAARQGFDQAIVEQPGATVVLSSVNGLLSDSGPYAPCPVSGFTRHSLLMKAFDSNVRKVVFVADYTKMRPKDEASYGDAIFSDKKQWRSIVDNYRGRLAIVVAPPPEVRSDPALMATRPADRVIRGKGYSQPLVEYLTVAAELDRLCSGKSLERGFYEAGNRPPSVASVSETH